MKYRIDNQDYEVIIIKKHNKNTYIRVKDDLKIYVTTNFLVTKKQIKKLLDKNYDALQKIVIKKWKNVEKSSKFYYLGNIYDIIVVPTFKKIEIENNRIYVKSEKDLNKWLKKETENIFTERLNYIYDLFEEKIPYPRLRIRKMTTRWGVCNRKLETITLNANLIREKIECLDYVIIHELVHFIHFNHSNSFWTIVSKYCPKYKSLRKELRD